MDEPVLPECTYCAGPAVVLIAYADGKGAIWDLLCAECIPAIIDESIGDPYYLLNTRRARPVLANTDQLVKWITGELIDLKKLEFPAESFRFRATRILDVVATAVEHSGLTQYLRDALVTAANEMADTWPSLSRRFLRDAEITAAELTATTSP